MQSQRNRHTVTNLTHAHVHRLNLKIVKELGDHQAQGRTFGNLGNTHYLLGNYKKAIKYHEEVRMCSMTLHTSSLVPLHSDCLLLSY